ncbi:MAG: glutamate decarboxylase [Clostridia bacterium]|nr:glutamate decarboxylase [Clostridia bacterium]
MWTVVYIAANTKIAENLKEILTREGLMVKLRPVGGLALPQASVEILVPESEAEEANEIINAAMGGQRLP